MRLRFLVLPAASLLALAACNNDAPAPEAVDETADAAADAPLPADVAAPID